MSSNKKKVLLCTGASSEIDNNENSYKKYLIDVNLECEILQVLDFEFVNGDILENYLLDAESYEALILTSPRAAIALTTTKTTNQSCIEPWIKKQTFCIGPTTESIAKEKIGLTNVYGAECGNAKNLANFIIKTVKEGCKKPFLLPCSDIARDTIPKMLSENGMDVKKIIVYKTKAHSGLKAALNNALKQSPHILVFFSPSVLNNILEVLSSEKNILEKFKIIAIGPVTEQALLNSGIAVDGVSEKPEPEALAKVIQQVA